jgi:hypothetical protein
LLMIPAMYFLMYSSKIKMSRTINHFKYAKKERKEIH